MRVTARCSASMRESGEAFVRTLGITKGMKVLDKRTLHVDTARCEFRSRPGSPVASHEGVQVPGGSRVIDLLQVDD